MARGRNAFLGTGWAFPVATAAVGAAGAIGVATLDGDALVEQAIRLVLGTSCGERVMNPDFGSRLDELVFAPLDTGTMQLAAYYARQALEAWEPRIAVDDVRASIAPGTANCLLISVSYRIRSRNVPRNLVYPFYLQEQ